MKRMVEQEILDVLPPDDVLACGSRADLRRLNLIMGHAGILSRAIDSSPFTEDGSNRVVELGAGDGTLLLDLARGWSARGLTGKTVLVDRQKITGAQTEAAFAELEWHVTSEVADVFDWLEETTIRPNLIIANLFLHHFTENQLRKMFRLAAEKCDQFVACEPRRAPLALAASKLLWLIGCNSVTRHDAVVSVRAGFRDQELSALWPSTGGWKLTEHSVELFSHLFVAQKNG